RGHDRGRGTGAMGSRRAAGALAFVLYAATVVAANWFVQHVGQATPGGGPHTIPVGFGYRAPSGVLWIGVAFTLRDVVQSTLGKWATVVGILVGAALSYVVPPALPRPERVDTGDRAVDDDLEAGVRLAREAGSDDDDPFGGVTERVAAQSAAGEDLVDRYRWRVRREPRPQVFTPVGDLDAIR